MSNLNIPLSTVPPPSRQEWIAKNSEKTKQRNAARQLLLASILVALTISTSSCNAERTLLVHTWERMGVECNRHQRSWQAGACDVNPSVEIRFGQCEPGSVRGEKREVRRKITRTAERNLENENEKMKEYISMHEQVNKAGLLPKTLQTKAD